MPSVTLELLAKRQEDIRLFVRRSSPVLIWAGETGIYVIAANKSRTRNRVYPIIDRMACVTRGEINSGAMLARTIIGGAWTLAQQRSIGDVHAHEIVSAIGPMLAAQYHDYFAPPLKAEAVIVKLMDECDQDYLAYTNYKGETHEVGPVFLMGTVNADEQNRGREEEDYNTLLGQLEAAWTADAQPHTMLDAFTGLPVLQESRAAGLRSAFDDSQRREIVMLDRTALRERRFEDIFKRIDT